MAHKKYIHIYNIVLLYMGYKSKRTPSKRKRNKTVKGGMFGRAAYTSGMFGQRVKKFFDPLINPPRTTQTEVNNFLRRVRNNPKSKLSVEQQGENTPQTNVISETFGPHETTQGNKPLGNRIGGYYKCKNKSKRK